MEGEFDELQVIVENIDSARKNNIKLHGLKQEAERDNLRAYLEEFVSGCQSADSDIFVQIVKVLRTSLLHKGNKNPRDILVQFVNWAVKIGVLNIFRGIPGVTEDTSDVVCFLGIRSHCP